MMNYIKARLAAFSLICLAMFVNKQNAVAQGQIHITGQAKVDSISQKTSFSVAVQPFFLLNNALKIDMELQPAGKHFGYVFTVEGYSGSVKERKYSFKSVDRPIDNVNGIGVGISQKYRVKDSRSSPYVAYGLTYRYQEIAIEFEDFFPYQENGLTYYGYGPLQKNLVVSSGLASATFGYQAVADDFVYDFYFGIGFKTQFKDTDFNGRRKYNDYQYSYAYKGTTMLVGLKVGYQIR